MTDRPIIMSAPMVRALLDNRKTETRRLLSPNNVRFFDSDGRSWRPSKQQIAESLTEARRFRNVDAEVWTWTGKAYLHQAPVECAIWIAHISPAVGDRLWVRESFCIDDNGDYEWAVFAADRGAIDKHRARIDALGPNFPQDTADRLRKLRPAIHMPRAFSRLTLLVTAVRIEPLHALTEEAARAEGVLPFDGDHRHQDDGPYKIAYVTLWNDLHDPRGRRAWAENPFVIVTSFTVHKVNIDRMENAAMETTR